jgi:hypothetical protein
MIPALSATRSVMVATVALRVTVVAPLRADPTQAIPRIGVLTSSAPNAPREEGLRSGLRELGYVDAKALRIIACGLVLALSSVALTWAADLPTADPQTLGFSSERLARIGPAIQRETEKGQYPGAVMLVARNGRIVYFESVGHLDPASGKAMAKDAIFRLYSMTKPYTSVAIMMLMEEGKLRVTDPVSKYIPAFANLQVSADEWR